MKRIIGRAKFETGGEARNNESAGEKSFEQKQEEVIKQLEMVDTVAEKLKEKYSQYETLSLFVDHLASTEKIFIIARQTNAGFDKTKTKFLESQMELMAEESGIDKKIYEKILNDFANASDNVLAISVIAENLKRQYRNREGGEDCLQFIDYIKEALLAFANITSNDLGWDEIEAEKLRIIEDKMKLLSADGNPEIETLRSIYEEFKKELEEQKKTNDNQTEKNAQDK
ncbi:MAG TPA: hypothetical protein ENJ49_01120 [Candidatus Moranbacteria bacterium]|nr:hypothetical protein [Candidatus Moranbacteria bacterium]